MKSVAPLRSRHREILQFIVRAYIETGEPVGSRIISRNYMPALSPATIRNAMADLAEEGYLAQPHTSAGRIPTGKAFQQYVQSLNASRIAATQSDQLCMEFRELHTVEARVEHSSLVLMQLTCNVGIAAAIPELSQEIDQIELIPLANRRVLIVLATRDHMVRNRVVALDDPITPDELISIRNYVNLNFGGWQVGRARRELLRRILEERAQYDDILRTLQVLYRKGLLEPETAPEVHMEGASNLLDLDLHLTREKMRELLRALEEKQRLIELLVRFLEDLSGELQVHVGLKDAHPAMKDLALIGINVRLGSGLPAKVAVLGPMRMNYERVMAAVLQTGRALEQAQF